MFKYLSFFAIVTFLVSCKTGAQLVGNWTEVDYKKETIQFHDDGRMEVIKNGDKAQTPIHFRYEIIDSKDSIILFYISVYNDTTLIKKAKTKATFKDKNTIRLENIDFPQTVSNTYSRN